MRRVNVLLLSLLFSTLLLGLIPSLHAATPQPGYPVPQIVGPTHPSAVVPGSLHFTLDVYGANFISSSVVNWNGSPRTTTYLSAHHLRAQINAEDVTTPTSGFITVTTTTPNGPIKSSTWAQVLVHEPVSGLNLVRAATPLNLGPPFMLADTTGTNRVDVTGAVNEGFETRLNNGDGTFTGAPIYATRYEYLGGAAMGDFNGDGYMDFVYPNGIIPSPNYPQKSVLGGPGAKYSKGSTYAVLSFTGPQFYVGDFNQDGVLDVLQNVGFPPFGSEVFLGNGDGTFAGSPRNSIGSEIVLGDFDNDGKLDVISFDTVGYLGGSQDIRLHLGNGDGTFQQPRTVKQGPSLLGNDVFFASDFNGDGNLDFMYVDASSIVVLYLGNGDGTFRNPTQTPFPTQAAPYVVDLNADGKMDVVAVGVTTATPLLGNGDGTFTQGDTIKVPYLLDSGPICFADFDGNGLVDMVAQSLPFGSYTVFFQK